MRGVVTSSSSTGALPFPSFLPVPDVRPLALSFLPASLPFFYVAGLLERHGLAVSGLEFESIVSRQLPPSAWPMSSFLRCTVSSCVSAYSASAVASSVPPRVADLVAAEREP